MDNTSKGITQIQVLLTFGDGGLKEHTRLLEALSNPAENTRGLSGQFFHVKKGRIVPNDPSLPLYNPPSVPISTDAAPDGSLNPKKWSDYCAEARKLVAYYEHENQIQPRNPFDYYSLEEVALRLWENDQGVTAVAIRPVRHKIHLICVPAGREVLAHGLSVGSNVEYTIDDVTNRAQAEFAIMLAGVMLARAQNGNSNGLRNYMPSSASSDAINTRHRAEPYVPKK
ncbi:MAG: hypothetical protein V1735_06535 [Nanoarchaeota archaeon]